ncbi:uncharacterized protein MYCFIDRAFT_199311 [Pseudocercospora fijiensis CIRAD86]|uniref:Uncharacterized protein n=1 Tax=Pseudocercospora fijiensis (strain CIRAD86) TaxID=383855 RepID=M2YPB2_PSEFD|nr:uncharacterized protein MYCFIDRAFT_199311 [Pseudocercospora fijiensis CIRAD86]EME79595.1 hypothetical protein MYCFIDRAFT_199311 [Pseudocercospora fijiensis CIRAD86]
MAISPPASLAASQHYGRTTHTTAQFLQPPKSPATVTTTPAFATATDYISTGSRKRQRPDSAHANEQHHPAQSTWTETPAWARCPTPCDKLYESGFGQHSVNERYRLAGGFDTPSLRATSPIQHLTVNEHEFRRRLRDDDMDLSMHSGCTPISGPLARERNGVARLNAVPDNRSQTTWTQFAFELVGKAFNFGTTVFKGFYSGGGRVYQISSSTGPDRLQHNSLRVSTPLPGSWDSDEFLGDFEQDSPYFAQQTSPTRPPAKRRQTDRDSWVLVGNPDAENQTSPKRKISGNSVPRSNPAPGRPTASRASSRRSLAPVSRKSSAFGPTNGSPVQFSPALAPPQQSQSRIASVAATRSPQQRPSSAGVTAYVSPDAERFVKRQAKQDRAADKTMTNMGNRIQEMMRQAQEALGTKYSVEGDGMDLEDEGYVDDDWQ